MQPNEYEKLYALIATGDGAGALLLVVRIVCRLEEEESFLALDEIMSALDLDKVNPTIALAFIAATKNSCAKLYARDTFIAEVSKKFPIYTAAFNRLK